MSVLYLRDKRGNFLAVRSINGKSAYQIAQDYGFEGSEEAWLESLKSTIVRTDKSLTQHDQAADAKAAGEAINQAMAAARSASDAAAEAAEAAREAVTAAGSAFDMARSAQTDAANAFKSANVASSNAAQAKQTAERALPGSGGTMGGDIHMDGSRVTGLGTPVNPGDAIPLGYVVPAESGGTGENTLAAALTAMLASGPIILTSEHYGDELPEPGTPGRLFFKKVSS